MKKPLHAALIPWAVVLVAIVFIWLLWPSQKGDPDFDAHVAHPAYAASRPRVYFDAATGM